MKEFKKVKSPNREELRSLIEEIGGPERLRKILLKFYEKMSSDILIGFFFEGRDLHSISIKQSEFILMAAGLIDQFDGKGPSTAHTALPPILAGHFDRRLVILREVLVQEGLTIAQQDRWIDFEESFRQIVVS